MATMSKDSSRRETCLISVPCEGVGGGSYGKFSCEMHCMYVCVYWRASRVPAAAVIPAPIVSVVYAAVKMPVVVSGCMCGACCVCVAVLCVHAACSHVWRDTG